MSNLKYYASVGLFIGLGFLVSNMHAPVLAVFGKEAVFDIVDVTPSIEDECETIWGFAKGFFISRYNCSCKSGEKFRVLYEAKASNNTGILWVSSYKELKINSPVSVKYIPANPDINWVVSGGVTREVLLFFTGILVLLVSGYILRNEIKSIT